MRKVWAAAAATTAILALALPAGAITVTPTIDSADNKVTGQTYYRHDGGTDAGIAHCNNTGTSTAPDTNTADGDIDSNDGGSKRQGNEPFSVIDPTDTDVVVAGWNDYCLTDLGAGWQGFAYSIDGGGTWRNSIVPGYPQDTSTEGQASPLFSRHTDAGDPIAQFDNTGRLFVGGISFNRVGAVNGDVYVATYEADSPPCAATTCPGYPVDYERTVVVGQGTPSRNIGGIFQDKPMLEVDRTSSQFEGNLYVCWSRFTGLGQNKVYFSRSTDHGATFSRPIPISRSSEVKSVQGCDIAVEADGDVYVTFRTFDAQSPHVNNGVAFARSTDGGQSFSNVEQAVTFTPYFPFDSSRDCGDGPELCPTGFVFHRVPLEPRATSDPEGTLPGVYITYNAVDPATVVPSTTSYSSGNPGEVGQSRVYIARSVDDGETWTPAAVDVAPRGHQYFPDIDAFGGVLTTVYHDSRPDPCYSVQLPIGNTPGATSCGRSIVETRFTYSIDGATFAPSTVVSATAHQPQYEMFANRDVPFQGDYNWIQLARVSATELFGYMTWTDNRDVVQGTDPRETTQDGFDVLQCRIPTATSPDQCANAGGLDQNIYGNQVSFSVTP
jgi:hypothetical protein